MKLLGAIFLILIGYLQYLIWWGDSGETEIAKLKVKLSQQLAENRLLKEQNQKLLEEINALKQNPELLEEKAREKLGLIKPGETFIRIIPKDD